MCTEPDDTNPLGIFKWAFKKSSVHEASCFGCACRYSKVICAEPNGNITLCAYQVGSKMSSARQLQTGGTYQLPPAASGIQPDQQEAFSTWQANVTQAAQLVQQKQGRAASVADGVVRAYQVQIIANREQ